MNYKKLWIDLLRLIEDGDKTSWGKVQLVQKMFDLEIEQAREEKKNDRD